MWKHEQLTYEGEVSGIGLTNLCENYAKTLTESTFDFAISAEDIRGGKGKIAPYVE